MAARVKLRNVVDAIDLPNEEWQSYVNPDTGEVITVTDEDVRLVERGDDLNDLPDWQREALPKIREVLESDRYLMLPDSFDVHEWSIMERFAQARPNSRQRDELLDSLHGLGAFRMFKAALRRLRIEDEWHQFRGEALEELAKDWLEEQNIPYQ
jgi:hypothetical protein